MIFFLLTINQSKHICVAPYVTNESEVPFAPCSYHRMNGLKREQSLRKTPFAMLLNQLHNCVYVFILFAEYFLRFCPALGCNKELIVVQRWYRRRRMSTCVACRCRQSRWRGTRLRSTASPATESSTPLLLLTTISSGRGSSTRGRTASHRSSVSNVTSLSQSLSLVSSSHVVVVFIVVVDCLNIYLSYVARSTLQFILMN